MATVTDYDLAPLLTEKLLNQLIMRAVQLDTDLERKLITLEQWRSSQKDLIQATTKELCSLFLYDK